MVGTVVGSVTVVGCWEGRVAGLAGLMCTLTSPGPTALTTTAFDLSTITGAWLPSVKTTTASRLSGLLKMTRGPSTSTSAPWKLAFSVTLLAGYWAAPRTGDMAPVSGSIAHSVG